MDEQDKALLLFQLGPVQKFIAQAETIGDLRAGSEILSRLTAAALRSVPDFVGQTIFPDVGANAGLEGIPNRFLAYVPRSQAEEIARKAADAARAELKALAQSAREKLSADKRELFDTQLAAFLQTTWSVLTHPSDDVGKNYANIGKLMAMRRNTREFAAWPEETCGLAKDFLSGKESAIEDGRGAINLVKRELHPEADSQYAFAEKYRAVIAMDGDRMGVRLGSFKTEAEHRTFSRRLAEFANDAEKFIPKDKGILVYAGGDDVLAIVEATEAFDVAMKLRDAFVAKMNQNGETGEDRITASAGIAVGSVQDPLQDLIHAAHAAESRAKHAYGRDALSVSVFKRSGEILEWGCKWGSKAFDIYERLRDDRRIGDGLSRFAYKLAGFLEPYALGERDDSGKSVFEHSEEMKLVVVGETLHTLKQTAGAEKVLPRELLEEYLKDELVVKRPEDYLGLFLVEAFINRKRDGKEN